MILFLQVYLSFVLLLQQTIWSTAFSHFSVFTWRTQAHQGHKNVFVCLLLSFELQERWPASSSFALSLGSCNMIKELVVPASRSETAEHFVLFIYDISYGDHSISIVFLLLVVLSLA